MGSRPNSANGARRAWWAWAGAYEGAMSRFVTRVSPDGLNGSEEKSVPVTRMPSARPSPVRTPEPESPGKPGNCVRMLVVHAPGALADPPFSW